MKKLTVLSQLYSYVAVNRGTIINSKVKWMWNGDWQNKILSIYVMIISLPNDRFTWNFLSALIVQHWQWRGKKQSRKFCRYYLYDYTEKPSKTAELQPEGAAERTMAAGGLCYSLIRSWVHKLSKNLEKNSKFYCQKCNIKQTPYSGANLQTFVTWDLHTADIIIKLKLYNMWNEIE
jgi:hypothetical protein